MNSSDVVPPEQPEHYSPILIAIDIVVVVGIITAVLILISYKVDLGCFTQALRTNAKKVKKHAKGLDSPSVKRPYYQADQYQRRFSEILGWTALSKQDGCPLNFYTYLSLIAERELAGPKRKLISEEVVAVLSRIQYCSTGSQLKGILRTIYEDKTLQLNVAINPLVGEAYWYTHKCKLPDIGETYFINIENQVAYEEP